MLLQAQNLHLTVRAPIIMEQLGLNTANYIEQKAPMRIADSPELRVKSDNNNSVSCGEGARMSASPGSV